MTIRTFAVLMLGAGILPGCAENQSAGFTGIGAEPAAVARRSQPAQQALDPEFFDPASVPILRVSGAGNAADLATQANDLGGAAPPQAALLRIGGQDLALSVVEVSGRPYAVAKPVTPDRDISMPVDAQQGFARGAGVYTGCRVAGPAYRAGPSAQVVRSMAVPLDCS